MSVNLAETIALSHALLRWQRPPSGNDVSRLRWDPAEAGGRRGGVRV